MTRDETFEELAQWIAIQVRERNKYRVNYEAFRELKWNYLNNPNFTWDNQDKNNAWLRDTRTQDAITAMKDAWACMQAAHATIETIKLQLDPVFGPELKQATERLRDKKLRLNK